MRFIRKHQIYVQVCVYAIMFQYSIEGLIDATSDSECYCDNILLYQKRILCQCTASDDERLLNVYNVTQFVILEKPIWWVVISVIRVNECVLRDSVVGSSDVGQE